MIRILTSGDWGPGQLRISHVHSSSRTTNIDVDRLIDQSWAAATAHPGVKLFDGPMCRLESWNASDESLGLVLSATSYKVFFGTNLTRPDLADTYGVNVLANPVGLSAALVTADDYLILGRRNASVAYYPNRIHPFAGCLEPADGPDLFGAVRRELREELGFTDGDAADIRCCGIVEDPAIRQPEVIFQVRSRRTREEVQAQVDDGEHAGSWAIAARPGEIETVVDNPQLTPVGVGALVLWGRARFGAAFLRRFEPGR